MALVHDGEAEHGDRRGRDRTQCHSPPSARGLRLLVDGDESELRDRAGRIGSELVRDAVPQSVGGLTTGERHHRGDLAVLGHLGACSWVLLQVLLDLLALVGIDGVECVGAQQLVHLGRCQPSVHDGPPVPMSMSVERIRLRPDRMRLFTVPSGSRKSAATSR